MSAAWGSDPDREPLHRQWRAWRMWTYISIGAGFYFYLRSVI